MLEIELWEIHDSQHILSKSMLKKQIRKESSGDMVEVWIEAADASSKRARLVGKSQVHGAANSTGRGSLMNCVLSSKREKKRRYTKANREVRHSLVHLHPWMCSWPRETTLFIYVFEYKQRNAAITSRAHSHQLQGPPHHIPQPGTRTTMFQNFFPNTQAVQQEVLNIKNSSPFHQPLRSEAGP